VIYGKQSSGSKYRPIEKKNLKNDFSDTKNVLEIEGLVKALGQLKSNQAVEVLTQLLKNTKFPSKNIAIDALGEIKNINAVKALIELLEDADPYVRYRAAQTLGKLRVKEAVEPLLNALNDDDEAGCWYYAPALGRIKDVKAVDPIIDLLRKKILKNDYYFTKGLVEALGQLKDVRAEEVLIQLIENTKNENHRWNEQRKAAVDALGKIRNVNMV
jgi:HEAT repeat protein